MDKALWSQVQPLLDKAIDMPAEERTAWLARLRDESPTIADELQRLLAREGTLDRRGFLDTPTSLDSLVGKMLDGTATALQRSELERALAPGYELQAEVGRGGMATVFRARDTRHGRDVAIKVIRPDAASVLGAERFLAEIRLTANLTHPNILPLLDSGQAGGALFYVMPFIEGETLRARMRREGALPVDDVRRVLRSVLEALAHAHEKGLVHRDIKPDNVLLAGRQAWVADFGIAKAVASSGTSAHAATSVGVALGSPGYMAPEQIEGSAAIDARTDLYAVGAMAWEMLAGRPVFTGESMQQLFMKHLTAVPEDLRTVRPEVPPSLADAVMRCLAKAPGDRWASASSLLDALEGPGGIATPVPLDRGTAVIPGWSRRTIVGAVAVVSAVAWYIASAEPTFAPGKPERLTTSGSAFLPRSSPDGKRIVFRSGEQPQQVMVQSIDSTTGRSLGSFPPGAPTWLDDSTIVLVSLPAPGRPDAPPPQHTVLDLATGTRLEVAWLSGPGRLLRPVSGRSILVRSRPGDTLMTMVAGDRRGPRDSVTVALPPTERMLWISGTPGDAPLAMASRSADSVLRLYTVTASGKRQLVLSATPRDTTPAVRALPRGGFRVPNGRHMFFPLSRDSMLRVDLESANGAVEALSFPVPGVPADLSTTGDLIVPSLQHISRTYRFPIPVDTAAAAKVFAEHTGDVRVIPSLAPDGRVLAQTEALPARQEMSVYLQQPDGSGRRLVAHLKGALTSLKWSPDGTRLATRFNESGVSARWIVIDVRSGVVTRLGAAPGPRAGTIFNSGFPPAWSPDGSTLYAPDVPQGPAGTLRAYRIAEGDTGVLVSDWWARREGFAPEGIVVSPDGKQLIVGGASIVVLDLATGGVREVVPADDVTLLIPFQVSPAGEILYATRDSRARALGMRGLAMAYTSGAPPRPLGTLSARCEVTIDVLASGREASCVEQFQTTDLYRIRGVR